MQKRNVLNSPRLLELKKERRRAILNKILFSLLGFFVIFFLAAYLSNLNKVKIIEIQINGNNVVDTEILKSTVEDQIQGKYLWLFSKANIFLYPQGTIENVLQEKFKRLKDINLSIKNNEILEVNLTERVAKYTWCGATLLVLGDQTCFFLDDTGYVMDEAPYFSGEVYFKFYGLTDGNYFSKQKFQQLILFKDVLVSLNIKPVILYVADNGDIEIYLSKGNTASTTNPKIIFNINSDFQNVAENLEAALNAEPLKTKFNTKYSSLEYIDLRFGNKVYDKFK
jgi:cell division septal protein FtsQ